MDSFVDKTYTLQSILAQQEHLSTGWNHCNIDLGRNDQWKSQCDELVTIKARNACSRLTTELWNGFTSLE